MAKKNLAAELAARGVQQLEDYRASQATYPPRLDALLQAVAGDSPPTMQAAATRHAAFKTRTVRGHASRLDAPVALAEDQQLLANSEQLFEFACRWSGSPGPPWNAADLAKQVAPAVRSAFQAALRQRRERSADNTLALTTDEWLTRRLLITLQQHFAAADAPPLLLSELAAKSGMQPARDQAKIKKAAASSLFAQHAVLLRDKTLDTQVATRARAEELLRSPRAIPALVSAACSAAKRIVSIPDIAKKAAPAMRETVSGFLTEQLTADRLPPGLGAVREGKTYKLFLLEDLQPSSLRRRLMPPQDHDHAPPPSSSTRAAPPDAAASPGFAQQFAQAFSRLDEQQGNHNQVSLWHLRNALPMWSREAFDAELYKLRAQGEFVLSGLQNRAGISPEEQEAGIREAGLVRIYVSRKR